MSELEVKVAVCSNRATMEWVSNLVAGVSSFFEAATEVMRVLWKRDIDGRVSCGSRSAPRNAIQSRFRHGRY